MSFIYFETVILNWGQSPPPRRPLAISRDIFGCHSWDGGAPDIQWVETRGATKYSTVRETVAPPQHTHPKEVQRSTQWYCRR